jgi:hypothetical protein
LPFLQLNVFAIPVGGGWVLSSPFPLALEHSLVEPGRAHLIETECFSDEYLRIRALFAKVGRRGRASNGGDDV